MSHGYRSMPVSPGGPLPPLISPNAAAASNARAFNLELQKTRANVMDTIQAESNARSRLNNKFESQINLAGHEFNPKIHTLDRQSSFTKKQLAALLQQITEINAVSIQNMKNSCENSKLQLEQKIKQDSINRLNPITEEQRVQVSKLQKVTENIVSFFSKISDSVRDLDSNFDKCDKDIADYNRQTSSAMSDITPRIAVIESKATALEATAEGFVRMIGQTQDMINKQKEIRDTLKSIEDEGIDNAVSQMGQEAYSVISSKTTELDQRISEAETNITSLEGSLQSAEQSQAQQDAQVNNMSRKFMELEGTLKSDEEEILGKLQSLDQKLQEVKTRLSREMEDHVESITSDHQFSEEDFQGNVQHLSDLSALDLKNLTNDWTEFTDNNKKVQNDVDEMIYNSFNTLQGKGNVVQRVKTCEQRLQWCMARLDYWARDDAKRKRSAMEDGDAMLRKVTELEEKMAEFENNLKQLDNKDAEPIQSDVVVHFTEMPPKPENPQLEPKNDKLSIDEKMRLTYAENDEFTPLKKSKEDEERAAERLKKLQEQKEKRKERLQHQQEQEHITEDFVNEKEEENSPQNNEEEKQELKEKPKTTKSMERLAIKDKPLENLESSKKQNKSSEHLKPNSMSLKANVESKVDDELEKKEEEKEGGLKAMIESKVEKQEEEEEQNEDVKKSNEKLDLKGKIAEKAENRAEEEEEDKKSTENLDLKGKIAEKAEAKADAEVRKSNEKLSLKGSLGAKL
ncbi:hypothetical protein TVAG_282110 [Trichomonas vaginalis G3]|uniref:Uncharacterized protein n=1 Tax=Trichomonas vaginalis (strain ATCC PRA-98 / G3) TaxID=412133 RepID=A2E9S6_TRIV3|nr:hypothetical protein TVAGG3_0043490 [Trichomonas vaginalis G3]EAY10611.1 hypothetical protein TVAG_282110 [Trichomonas vaginalis G3]KAI5540863.1 hypothetical protein TVAGG3_0043490 [Trichomonas vaginalis G3]|eukprot:XP_001322834.1 hypothetical protein [Trichomonas vaginalis G3]